MIPNSSLPLRAKKSKVDVLFVTTDLAVGGAENQVQDLALRLSARGWRIALVSMMPTEMSTERLHSAGVRVEDLALARGSADVRGIVRLRQVVRRLRPQLVHSHMIHANLLARITRTVAPIPVLVCTSHNVNEGGQLRTWAIRLTDGLANRTTHVSRVGLDQYLRRHAVAPRKASWIPNGVDLRRFERHDESRSLTRATLGVSDTSFLWLTVGSLTRQKAQHRLVHAFAEIQEEAILAIVGEGPLRTELEELARETHQDDRIRFLGLRADVEALMSAADAFVLSSSWEGLPLVLIEAASSHLPIVSTNVGGCGEIVEDGINGTLVASLSSAALSSAMQHIMALPADSLLAMGDRGRTLMDKQYDIDHVVTQWEDLYGSVLRGG